MPFPVHPNVGEPANGYDKIFGRRLAPLCRALQLLLSARVYGDDAQRDVWDFAVEGKVLQAVGLNTTEMRWLVCKGYVQHASEVTHFGDERRSFRPSGSLTFTKRTCFVLTDLGAEFAHEILDKEDHSAEPSVPPEPVPAPPVPKNGSGRRTSQVPAPTPIWDCDYREVQYLGKVVKQFKLPSPNQESILMAFQEEGWPPKIDDPLPPHPDCDPKQRLHDTIRSLNRNQKTRLLRFRGDGTGQGILWEPVQPGTDEESA